MSGFLAKGHSLGVNNEEILIQMGYAFNLCSSKFFWFNQFHTSINQQASRKTAMLLYIVDDRFIILLTMYDMHVINDSIMFETENH